MNMNSIADFMDKLVADGKVPGCDCIIYQNHKQLFRHMAGWSDYDRQKPVSNQDIYRCYSITKVMTAVAALQLVEQNLLDPLAPVSDYLPEYADLTIKTGKIIVLAAEVMRVWHLFSMTAGLDYNEKAVSIQDCIRASHGTANSRQIVASMAKEPLSFEPGDRYQYSFCHDVLGAIIEIVSGMTLEDYFQKNIIQPLGMDNTTMRPSNEQKKHVATLYDLDPVTKTLKPYDPAILNLDLTPNYLSGGAGLYSCPGDYIKLADALACGGAAANGVRILRGETVKKMQHNLLGSKQLVSFRTGEAAEGRFESYGYGYGVRVRMIPSKAGCPVGEFRWSGAAGAYLLIDPVNQLCFFYTMHVRLTRASWEIAPVIQELMYESLSER